MSFPACSGVPLQEAYLLMLLNNHNGQNGHMFVRMAVLCIYGRRHPHTSLVCMCM